MRTILFVLVFFVQDIDNERGGSNLSAIILFLCEVILDLLLFFLLGLVVVLIRTLGQRLIQLNSMPT